MALLCYITVLQLAADADRENLVGLPQQRSQRISPGSERDRQDSVLNGLAHAAKQASRSSSNRSTDPQVFETIKNTIIQKLGNNNNRIQYKYNKSQNQYLSVEYSRSLKKLWPVKYWSIRANRSYITHAKVRFLNEKLRLNEMTSVTGLSNRLSTITKSLYVTRK